MDLKVSKFGGVCMANSLNIQKVIGIINGDIKRKILVVSAPGVRFDGDIKVTDLLYRCYEEIKKTGKCDNTFPEIEEHFKEIIEYFDLPEFLTEMKNIKITIEENKQKDFIASRGEFLMAKILAKILNYTFVDATEIIKFDKEGKLDTKNTYKLITKKIGKYKSGVVIPGFYGECVDKNIKTFSRDGTDFTGSLVAAAIEAQIYENWKDINGIMSTNPRLVNKTYRIEELSYHELRELSYMGAKIIHPSAVMPVCKKNIPIVIKSIFEQKGKGTTITNKVEKKPSSIKAITEKLNLSLITIKKIIDNTECEYFYNLFAILKNLNISLVQFLSDVDCVNMVVDKEEFLQNERELINAIEKLKPDEISIEKDVVLVTLVGNNIVNSKNIIKKICTILQKNNIPMNTLKVSSHRSSIIIGINNENSAQAIKLIHNMFFK